MGKTYFKENIMGEKNDVFKIGYADTDIYSVTKDLSNAIIENTYKINYYDRMFMRQPEIKKSYF